MNAKKKRRRLILVLLPLLIVLLALMATGRSKLASTSQQSGSAPASTTQQSGNATASTTQQSGNATATSDVSSQAPEAYSEVAAQVATTAVPAPATSAEAVVQAATTAVPVSATTSEVVAVAPSPEKTSTAETSLPEGFVPVSTLIPDLHVELRYLGDNNFTGRPVDGYEANTAILTLQAAQALANVQSALATKGYGLIVYDAYRPTQAVADFVRWGGDLDDQIMKAAFYPDIPKADILGKGFVATRSSHSRGSTVDVSLVHLSTGEALDMGTPFDWFGPESDPDYSALSAEQAKNRSLLRTHMEKEGFVISSIEWWHFRLKNEPFPKTYFDFPVR